MMQPLTISLFAGAGGCSLGFKKAGAKIVYALDFDRAAAETYRQNFPDTKFNDDDIRQVDFRQLLDRLDLGPGELDLLIGGPPCQGFSTAGSRFWDDPRNALVQSYVSALSIVRPKWFLMENVEGLLTSKGGEYVSEVVNAVVDLGYYVRLEKVYAHEHGIPQRRKRVVIVGNRLGIDFVFPEPAVSATGAIFRHGAMTLREAISGLPPAQNVRNGLCGYNATARTDWESAIRNPDGTVTDHWQIPLAGKQLARVTALLPGQTMKHLAADLQHESFKRRANRRVADGTPSEKRGGAPSGLKRLHFDEPCLTITSAATRELIHPNEHRPLTIRECARLQTFPDSFMFCGSAAERIQQIGNAIPPHLAFVLAQHIMSYGFNGTHSAQGRLLGFKLTKAMAMSPSLEQAYARLEALRSQSKQMELFA